MKEFIEQWIPVQEYADEVNMILLCLIIALVIRLIVIPIWRRINWRFGTLRKIDKMEGVEFEMFLKKQFEKRGFKVELTPVCGDFGGDLLLRKRKYTCVVQAKRYRGSVGVHAVQEVIGAVAYYEVDESMVITNSYYTKAARELAEKNDVILWDRDDLCREFHIKQNT